MIESHLTPPAFQPKCPFPLRLTALIVNMSPKESDTYSDPLDGDGVAKTDSWPTLKRGDKNFRYGGVFMGGGTFNTMHQLKKKSLFKTSFQVAMQSAQKVLFELKNDDTKITFDGKLEIPKDSILLGKELNF